MLVYSIQEYDYYDNSLGFEKIYSSLELLIDDLDNKCIMLFESILEDFEHNFNESYKTYEELYEIIINHPEYEEYYEAHYPNQEMKKSYNIILPTQIDLDYLKSLNMYANSIHTIFYEETGTTLLLCCHELIE